MKYIEISDGIEAKVQNGRLFVRVTNMVNGMLEQGGRVNKVLKIPYSGTLDKAQEENDYGVSDIDRCIENGVVVRQGRKIE